MSKVMFLGSFQFKSKTSGRDSYAYRFVEFYEDKGEKKSKDNTLFSDSPISTVGLIPGDIVDVKFSDPTRLGGRPAISAIIKLENSNLF